MTLIVAGTFRVPPENVEPLRPHMVAVMEATRLEEGCLVYSYGEDVGDPGLIRVFEAWRDQACLDAHFVSAHMKQWQVNARRHPGFTTAASQPPTRSALNAAPL